MLGFSIISYTFPDEFFVFQQSLFYFYNVKIGKWVA